MYFHLNENVNRSTIINAYQELKSEGLINSDVGRGTYVIFDNKDTLSNK